MLKFVTKITDTALEIASFVRRQVLWRSFEHGSVPIGFQCSVQGEGRLRVPERPTERSISQDGEAAWQQGRRMRAVSQDDRLSRRRDQEDAHVLRSRNQQTEVPHITLSIHFRRDYDRH